MSDNAAKKQDGSNGFESELDFYNHCFEFSEERSLAILKETSGIQEMDSRPLPECEDYSNDHWVCSITIALGEAKVYIKAHFDSKTARKVAAAATQLPEENIPTSVLIDFMREYLNRIMGDIKSHFMSENVEVSVPNISPSYDEGIYGKSDLDMNAKYWKIKWQGGQFVLGCYISVIGDVTSIKQRSEDEEDQGGITFL